LGWVLHAAGGDALATIAITTALTTATLATAALTTAALTTTAIATASLATAPSRTMRSVLPSRPISPHILATSAIAATADADEAGRVRGCSTQSVLHDCCTRHDCRCPDSYHINRNL
jgi:hypothetical protein